MVCHPLVEGIYHRGNISWFSGDYNDPPVCAHLDPHHVHTGRDDAFHRAGDIALGEFGWNAGHRRL
jgi:hypothetical protein